MKMLLIALCVVLTACATTSETSRTQCDAVAAGMNAGSLALSILSLADPTGLTGVALQGGSLVLDMTAMGVDKCNPLPLDQPQADNPQSGD